ncbi:hypothetical protein K440DRAFT_589065 [Wilcoxina mikolae CBS 423.85]|nr:hypothetical protein K440DRAFT_589065 [Wilcoxina mikolae CBS 423.85]
MSAARPPVPIPAAISRALSRFRNSLDSEEKKAFNHVTTESEVRALIENLEAEQGARGCLQNMTRLEPFIKGISQYAAVIEVFVQAKPDILSFIWGPIKLLLQLSSKFIESFDRLLDACQRIGENLPRFTRFTSIFSYSEQIQNVISLLYEDILDFYRRTLKFFRRRAWKIFFSLAWNDFETRFGNILENIQRHQNLIDYEARAEDIIESQKARENAQKLLEKKTRERQTKRKKACADWLSPADVDTTKDNASQEKTPGTSEWLLNSREMTEWLDGDPNSNAVIWLHGIPGAGKTVLSSTIIERLQEMKQPLQNVSTVLYFFCSYKLPDKNTCLAILRSFIYQIILQDEQLIAYVYNQYTTTPHSITMSVCKKMLAHLFDSCSPIACHIYIVIDGLDELPEAERAEFLPILKKWMIEKPVVLRFFIGSQDLPDIRKVLSRKTTRIVVGDKNKKDILKYIESETQDLVGELDPDEVPPDIDRCIIDSLASRAGGMFLWARLVIKGLLSSVTVNQIENTLKNLPVGLEQTYERILDRIRSLPHEERALSMKLLQWMTCSTRAMTLREFEDAVGTKPGILTVDKKDRPLRARLRGAGAPIVETVGEDTVVFVHFSAKEYLISKQSGPFIDRSAAHLNIAIVCATYYGFTCFDQQLSEERAVGLVLHGDLRLLEYVHSSWIKHVLEAYKSSPRDSAQLHLLSSLLRHNVFEKHFTHGQSHMQRDLSAGSKKRWDSSFESLGYLPGEIRSGMCDVIHYRAELQRSKSSDNSQIELEEWCDQNDPMDIEKTGRKLRQILENILEGKLEVPDEPDVVEKLRTLYGQKLYRCRRQSCAVSCAEGFETSSRRDQHEDGQDFRYKCSEENCFYKDVGFSSKAKLQRHSRDHHNTTSVSRPRVNALKELDSAIIHKMNGTKPTPPTESNENKDHQVFDYSSPPQPEGKNASDIISTPEPERLLQLAPNQTEIQRTLELKDPVSWGRLSEWLASQLKQSSNPMGWQKELSLQERVHTIMEIVASIKLVRTDIEQGHAIQIATNFEKNTYDKAIQKSDYNTQCREKLVLIQEQRKKTLNPKDAYHQSYQAMRARGLAPGQAVGPQPTMIGPPSKPGESSLLASLPPYAVQQAAMHKMNQQGQLNPQPQQILRAAIEQMQIRHLRQRQSRKSSASVINGPREMQSTRQLEYTDDSEARLPTHHLDAGATSAPDAQFGQRHTTSSSPIQSTFSEYIVPTMVVTSTIDTENEESRFDSSYGYPRSATNSWEGGNPNDTEYTDVTANYPAVFNNQSAYTFGRGDTMESNKSEDPTQIDHLSVANQTEAQRLAHEPDRHLTEFLFPEVAHEPDRRQTLTEILFPPERDDETKRQQSQLPRGNLSPMYHSPTMAAMSPSSSNVSNPWPASAYSSFKPDPRKFSFG